MMLATEQWSPEVPHRTAPRDGVTEARLSLAPAGCRVALMPIAASASYRVVEPLFEAWFDGADPEVHVAGGEVDLTLGHWSMFSMLRRARARVALNPDVVWAIDVHGGLHRLHANLGIVRIARFVVEGGVNDLGLEVGMPVATARVHIEGGAHGFTFRRPAGVPVRVRVEGGANRVVLDDLRLGAVGGGIAWESPDYASAADRYELIVEGGADTLTVTT